MYGFFRCGQCNAQWESSHVYVESQDGDKPVSTKYTCKSECIAYIYITTPKHHMRS